MQILNFHLFCMFGGAFICVTLFKHSDGFKCIVKTGDINNSDLIEFWVDFGLLK